MAYYAIRHLGVSIVINPTQIHDSVLDLPIHIAG